MKTTVILLAVIGILISSCHSKRNQFSLDGLSEAYAREYTFQIVNPETGAKIGMRAVRDTIFIRSLDEGYEVSNSKWMFNDYDQNGWRDMKHSENRPFATYQSKYDSKNNSLSSRDGKKLRFEPNNELVYSNKGIVYNRIKK